MLEELLTQSKINESSPAAGEREREDAEGVWGGRQAFQDARGACWRSRIGRGPENPLVSHQLLTWTASQLGSSLDTQPRMPVAVSQEGSGRVGVGFLLSPLP